MVVHSTSLHIGDFNQSYTATISAQGGAPPYQYSLASGQIPPGLNLGAATGVISGTPIHAGQYAFDVQAKDANGNTGTGSFTLQIRGVYLTLSPALPYSLPAGIPMTPLQLTVSGGLPPYTVQLVHSLPPED